MKKLNYILRLQKGFCVDHSPFFCLPVYFLSLLVQRKEQTCLPAGRESTADFDGNCP
jgi:hypothetical protein